MNSINPLYVFKNFFILLFGCLLLTACGNESSGLPTQSVDLSQKISSIAITPSNVSLNLGETQEMQVTITYADGTTKVLTSEVVWSSSNEDVVSVTDSGVITANELGQGTLTAFFNGVTSDEITININDDGDVDSLVISPSAVSIGEGETAQLSAVANFVDGTSRDVTAEITWVSSNEAVAVVSATGLVTTTGVGQSNITAKYNDTESSIVPVSVGSTTTPPTEKTISSIQLSPGTVSIAKGTEAQYNLIAIYEDGTSEDITDLAVWNSSNPDVATMSDNGSVSGVDTGSAVIKGSYLGVDSNESTITINSALLTSIQVSSGSPTVAKGATQQFVATGYFSDGTTQDLSTQVTWKSSDISVATINTKGAVSAIDLGQTNITAEFSGVTSNATPITVTNAVISSLQISPASNRIAKGVDQKYTAIAIYSDGTSQDVSVLANWAASNTTVVAMKGQASVSGMNVGTTKISATYLGASSNQATLEVTTATITTITVTPNNLTIPLGVSSSYTASAILSDGSNMDVTQQVTWVTNNPVIATIDATGKVQGNMVGSTLITAQQQGIVSNSATLTISAATVDSIQITPGNATIAKGTSLNLTAIAILSDGTSQDVTDLASWVVSDVVVATVSSEGVVNGTAMGSVTITGQYQGINRSVPVTISAATVSSVQVTPGVTTLAKGTAQTFIATAVLSDGSNQDVSNAVTWQSSNSNAVTINGLGVASADDFGNAIITAIYQGATSNNAQVTVSEATVSSIQVTPGVSTLAKGTEQKFVATAVLSDGTSQDVSDLVTWQSSDSDVVTINSSGLANADQLGSAMITGQYQGVTSNGVSVTVSNAMVSSIQVTPGVSVLAKGTKQAFVATAVLSDGTNQDVSNLVTWQSNDSDVVTINSSGVADADQLGSAMITAQYQGVISNDVSVTVSNAMVSTIQVTPSVVTLAKGTWQALVATAVLSDGSSQDVSDLVTWQRSDSDVVTINGVGIVSADELGSAMVTAQYQGVISNDVSVTVSNAMVSTIQVTPGVTNLAKGTTQVFVASAILSDGSNQDISNLATWQSSDNDTATINSLGLATADNIGSTVITAKYQGVTSNNASLMVTSAMVTNIEITPGTASLAKGTTQAFVAKATLSDGTIQDITNLTTWQTSDPFVASVDASGLASANQMGGATVTAQYLGVTSNNVSLTVTTATVSSIAVTPDATSIAKGTTQSFVAKATLSDGTIQDISDLATWQSSSIDVTSINAVGLANANNMGTATVTAQYLGVIVSSIAITPGTASLAKGTTQAFVATATLSDGTMQDISDIATWQSSDSGVATIDSSGVASADNQGSSIITAQYLEVISTGVSLNVTAKVLTDLKVKHSTYGTFIVLLGLGDTRVTAVGIYSDGTEATLNNADVTFMSSEGGLIYVDADGIINLLVGVVTSAQIRVATLSPSLTSSNYLQLDCLANVPVVNTRVCTATNVED